MKRGLDALQAESYRVAEEHGFHDAQEALDPKVAALYVRTALVIGELSEALEELRAGHQPWEVYYGADGKPEGFPVELADALIRLCDLAESVKRLSPGGIPVPLGDVAEIKAAFNRTRTFLHGGKSA